MDQYLQIQNVLIVYDTFINYIDLKCYKSRNARLHEYSTLRYLSLSGQKSESPGSNIESVAGSEQDGH